MGVLSFIIIISILISCYTWTIFVKGANFEQNHSDKLILSPLQIVDMVLEEKTKTVAPRNWQHFMKRDRSECSHETTTELSELSDDETLLRLRKVWSRWSKWGECSVTCGSGTMRRQRVCVAGRCARGEHEDQCRPCARTPCNQLPIADEPHDGE